MTREGARARRGEKGGRDAAAAIGPQATGHGPQRRGLVTEPQGDLVDRLVLDEDRAERLVPALEGLLGHEEEPPGVAPVHDTCPRVVIIFRPETAAERTPKTGAEPGPRRARARRGV